MKLVYTRLYTRIYVYICLLTLILPTATVWWCLDIYYCTDCTPSTKGVDIMKYTHLSRIEMGVGLGQQCSLYFTNLFSSCLNMFTRENIYMYTLNTRPTRACVSLAPERNRKILINVLSIEIKNQSYRLTQWRNLSLYLFIYFYFKLKLYIECK